MGSRVEATAVAGAAARRGEALFRTPFAADPPRSCATCHVPETGFIDRQSHDVGGGKAHDTPTLRDLAVTAPYFRDGRYDTLEQVIAHFDRHFDLGLDATETADLVAYLEAVGGGAEPYAAPDGAIHVATIADLLERAAEAFETQAPALASLLAQEAGIGQAEAVAEIGAAAAMLRRHATGARAAFSRAQTLSGPTGEPMPPTARIDALCGSRSTISCSASRPWGELIRVVVCGASHSSPPA